MIKEKSIIRHKDNDDFYKVIPSLIFSETGRIDLSKVTCINNRDKQFVYDYSDLKLEKNQKKILDLKSALDLYYYNGLWNQADAYGLYDSCKKFIEESNEYLNNDYLELVVKIENAVEKPIEFFELVNLIFMVVNSCQDELHIRYGFNIENEEDMNE